LLNLLDEITEEQRHASLAQGIFAGFPFVPSMARGANRLGKQAVNASVQIGNKVVKFPDHG